MRRQVAELEKINDKSTKKAFNGEKKKEAIKE